MATGVEPTLLGLKDKKWYRVGTWKDFSVYKFNEIPFTENLARVTITPNACG